MSVTRIHTMITAHAGAENTPANTLESLRALAVCGADALEMDVRAGEDGPVLSHNPLEVGVAYTRLEDALSLVRELNDSRSGPWPSAAAWPAGCCSPEACAPWTSAS